MKVTEALFVVLVFATVDARFRVGGLGKLKNATPEVQALAEEVLFMYIYIYIYFLLANLFNLTRSVVTLPPSSYVNLSHILRNHWTNWNQTWYR